MAAYELSDKSKKIKEEWENESLTKEQINYNRQNVGETEEEKKRYNENYGDWSVRPTFKLENGKVKVTGSAGYLKSDIVKEAKNTLSNYFKGYDLSNNQVSEAFNKTLNETNKQIDSYLNYQEYNKFLKNSGFSDEAYRNYALAVQEADPNNSTNIRNSKKKITGYGKDGKTLTLTPAEWLDYYKKNWNPEERAQMWMDAAEALARASNGKGTDKDLYKALPYILMGSKQVQNIPAQIINMVNPFDEGGTDWGKDIENAKVMVPVYGFEDTDHLSVFTQTFLRQLAMRGLQTTADVVDALKNPWYELGSPSGASFFGIEDFKNSDLAELTREEYQEFAQIARDAKERGLDTYEKLKAEYGAPMAKLLWTVSYFSTLKEDGPVKAVGDGKVLDTIRDENGNVVAEAGDYPGYATYRDLQKKVSSFDEGSSGQYEKWVQSNIDAMNEYVQKMSAYAPNAASAGIVGGQLASIAAEQFFLGLVSGGTLAAPRVLDSLSRAGFRFASGMSKAAKSVEVGEYIISKSPKAAQVISALALGGEKGWGAAKGLDAASKLIYIVGEIGTWALKEVGEDAYRGIVDDIVTNKSIDSQGNLDVNKFVENVYMNAVMAGMARGVKGAFKGLASIVDNASTRDIDGVELNLSQRHQLDLFQKALDDQNRRIQFKGWNEDGNPVISLYGKTKVLDQLTPSKDVMQTVDDATGAVMPTASRTIEEIMADEEVSDGVKQKISEVVEEQKADNGDIKTKIEEKLTDDEIREAFPDGTMKVGDQTIKVDTKEFTAGDVGRTTGKEFSNMDEAIAGLKGATKTSDFASGVRGILRHSVAAAKEFKQAIQDFADANNMTVRDVMIAIRESRLSGQEKIPGLQELWDNSWKPLQEKLLDLQEALTGIRPTEHNFYFRDMLEGTFKLGDDGKFSINLDSVEDALGGDTSFDLSASSTAHNSGKLGDIAADRLEYDPEVLMREFVASRMQTIWQTNDMGKVFATMEEAHAAGEFDFTEADAKKSVDTTKQVATEVESSEGVQAVQEMTNVSELDENFGSSATTEVDSEIEATKARIADLEKQLEHPVVVKTDDGVVYTVSDEPGAGSVKPASAVEKVDASWYNSSHPVEDGKIDDPSQRVIPKISEVGEDIRGANRPEGYGTPEYLNKSSDDYTEEDWKYSARKSLERYEELVAQRNELEKSGWKNDVGRDFTEREAFTGEDGKVIGYGASDAENLDLSISSEYNNYQDALSHLRGGATGASDSGAVKAAPEVETTGNKIPVIYRKNNGEVDFGGTYASEAFGTTPTVKTKAWKDWENKINNAYQNIEKKIAQKFVDIDRNKVELEQSEQYRDAIIEAYRENPIPEIPEEVLGIKKFRDGKLAQASLVDSSPLVRHGEIQNDTLGAFRRELREKGYDNLSPEAKARVDNVDKDFSQKLTNDMVLYRGETLTDYAKGLKEGDKIDSAAWTYVTPTSSETDLYRRGITADKKSSIKGGVLFRYHTKAGQPVFYDPGAHPLAYSDDEMILPRDIDGTITKVTNNAAGKVFGTFTPEKIIDVEVKPSGVSTGTKVEWGDGNSGVDRIIQYERGSSQPAEVSTKVELAAEKVRLKDLEARRRAILNAETFSDDEAKIDEEISTLNKDIERMKADIKERQTPQYKKQTVQDFHKLDYETRKQMVKEFVRHNPEYVAVYRVQNTGVDDWYANGRGVHGDNKTFDSYGSDKGDLKDAVWLTTDEAWAEGDERASAGALNGAPDQTVVIPIKRSLIVDAGGEMPSYNPELGEADMTYYDSPYYSLRRFSELNNNKIVRTRATQLEDRWLAARDENGGVTNAMRNRLNPEYYDHTELVLFKDQLPDVKAESEQAVVDFANENAKAEAEAEVNSRINQKAIRNLENDIKTTEDYIDGLKKQKAAMKNEAPAEPDTSDEATQKAELKQEAESNKKEILETQRKFNASAKKSNAAELISRNSGYSNRATRVDARAPIGVNFLPGNPFGKFFSWVNDHFTKANSIKVEFSGYKADGSPTTMAITAYNGGYKMYAEAGSFARNVIVDVQNGETLWDAIYKQVYDNGFFIEPSKSQIKKYGALRVQDQAAKVTDKIMDRISNDSRLGHVFNDDGTVKSTEGLISILTTRFMGQGISDFTKFVRKLNWDSLTKGQRDWLNARMYEMTASVNKNTARKVVEGLMRASMALRYKSNMYWNFKNGQLQLTECQRLFTMNKLGDFSATLKRLVTDAEYRQKASDYTYILAADSAGAGLSKSELDSSTDAFVKVGAASVFSKEGILTNIDTVKAKFGEIDDAALASIHGGEYAKNFILIAGFLAAGERQGLSGAELDAYVRNRFNVEALAGTKVGKIGLTDSRIGQFTFMYLGFPIRDLVLQVHTIRGGGTMGGKGWKRFVGAADYLGKMLGAKGLMWAVEAPWGYSLMDQLNIDPFGVLDQYDPINTPYEEREPGWRVVDYLVKYNPLLQGAMTNTAADIYMKYRAAEEEARANYKEQHDGSTEGFQWSIFQDGAENFNDIMQGLAPIGSALNGYIPGYTAYSRAMGEMEDLDRGYHLSQSGNRMYETNTDLGNALWGAFTGRKNTANAQAYYQTPNPIRGLIDNGIAGLGQQLERALPVKIDDLLAGKNPFRKFREFDPVDSETYDDWFDGSYQDQQNWTTGLYQFREEAQQIQDKYDNYISEGREVNTMNARENELADLRTRLEAYAKAYAAKHPEGISISKQNQLINVLNMNKKKTLDQAFAESQGEYTDEWDKAENRYMQGDFPTPYGLTQNEKGEISYAQSPQLQQALSQHRYGISSDAAPAIKQLYNSQEFDTPLGKMTMKAYHDAVYEQLQAEWDKSKPNYDKISSIQDAYLKQISKNIIQPILNTYGSSVLSAGKSSDIMQEFGKMLYSMIPSNEYRIDKKGRQIYKSTPYMTVDIPKWLNKNFGAYKKTVNTTNRATQDRLDSIRSSLNQGHQSTAKAKARALIQDIGNGKASVSRDELEWLQGVLND